MDDKQTGTTVAAEAKTNGAPDEKTDDATQRAHDAADEALARAGRPPAALGGPEGEDEPDAPTHPQPGAEAAFARTIAAKRAAEGPDSDVQVVGDEFLDARDAVAQGSTDESDLQAVQEWLLSDEAEVNTRKLLVRLGGSDDKPVIAGWWIRAIGIDVIRSAEREAAGANRAQRRGGNAQYDELKANLRIVVEGTLSIGAEPDDGGQDLKQMAKAKGLADATVFLQQKFRFRPGAIAQIAGEVMALSGFDQEDVRAAGN